ncbi:hypothetical protein HH214_04280 [Mucilaginibacter robiniae]|uniref:DNA-packaging protein gp3 n=1 Tax=Mucilaginibacter robiniae TaxID=2728022 RepID=A0A7L5DVN2_9SPHI|nr:terminase small subunit [Mucilaginibacter robiniae]QJD95150.1 hypothetical protein HH214_04280 [Mucilaginibacter robiniae]
MKRKFLLFNSTNELTHLITKYFNWIEGEYHLEDTPVKTTAKSITETIQQKVWDREPQPATLSGLALYLGFESRQAFEQYETSGRFAAILKRARLQIESEYEKKLHFTSATGAIFALKSIGWTDKSETDDYSNLAANLKVEIQVTGPIPAGSEKEVTL